MAMQREMLCPLRVQAVEEVVRGPRTATREDAVQLWPKLRRSIVLFLQAFQAQGRALYSGHLFWTLHPLPFSDVFLGATAANA